MSTCKVFSKGLCWIVLTFCQRADGDVRVRGTGRLKVRGEEGEGDGYEEGERGTGRGR